MGISNLLDEVLKSLSEYDANEYKPDATNEFLKESLLYAGKLALKAQDVINSNAKNLSNNIEKLSDALNQYDTK